MYRHMYVYIYIYICIAQSSKAHSECLESPRRGLSQLRGTLEGSKLQGLGPFVETGVLFELAATKHSCLTSRSGLNATYQLTSS